MADMSMAATHENAPDRLMEVFQCPTTWNKPIYRRGGGHSYGANAMVVLHRTYYENDYYTPMPFSVIDKTGQAQRIPLVFDNWCYSPDEKNVAAFATTNPNNKGIVNTRHDMGLNFGFADGHVAFLRHRPWGNWGAGGSNLVPDDNRPLYYVGRDMKQGVVLNFVE